MKTKVFQKYSNEDLRKDLLMSEYDFFDGDEFITFNIYDINLDSNKVTVAISNRGRISVDTLDLLQDKKGNLFFEYGLYGEIKIALNDFIEVA